MKRKFTAVMPISAYPFHFGHTELFLKGQAIFGAGNVLILICNNSSKSYFAYDRMQFFRKHQDELPADVCEGLVADYCQENGIQFIIRGIRNARDFDYENEISNFNEMFGLQTVFIPPPVDMAYYSSTKIRELLKYGKIKQASAMCPIGLEAELEQLALELQKNER